MKLFKPRHVSMATLRNSFDRRSLFFASMQGGVGALLAGRLGYLAVTQNEKYQLEAESNRVNLSLIPPRRGWSLAEAERQQLGSPQHNLPIDPAALDKETRERLGV